MFYVEAHCFYKVEGAWYTRLVLMEHRDTGGMTGPPTGRKILIEVRGASASSIEKARQKALKEVR